jgi:hypothetical protein
MTVNHPIQNRFHSTNQTLPNSWKTFAVAAAEQLRPVLFGTLVASKNSSGARVTGSFDVSSKYFQRTLVLVTQKLGESW